MSLLFLSSLRYLKSHAIQVILCILGIAMGVAVVVGIDLARYNAATAFDETVQTLQGTSTHTIIAGAKGVPEYLYRDLRVDGGFDAIHPVIEGTVTLSAKDRQEVFYLLGLDPFADHRMRDLAPTFDAATLNLFLTEPSFFLSSEIAQQWGLVVGDFVTVVYQGQEKSLKLIGILSSPNPLVARQLERLMVTDIGTSQILMRQEGWLTQIDVNDDGVAIQDFLKAHSSSAELISLKNRKSSYDKMTRAFSLNLQAMSFLALLVGLFLIYNSMSFLVAQRKDLWVRLRMVGLKRSELLSIVFKEGALIGGIATILGIGLGIFLSLFLTQLVTRAINDLYFVLKVTQIHIDWFTIVKAVALGLGGTALACVLPALEAMQIHIKTKDLSSKIVVRLFVGSIFLGGAGYVVLRLWPYSIVAGFAAVFMILVAALGWIPFFVQVATRLMRPLFRTLRGRMAIQDVTVHFHRSMVALASLILAVSVSLGTTIMIQSFRQTVDHWLTGSLVSDIYISSKGLVARRATTFLDERLVQEIKSLPDIARVNTYREYEVRSPLGNLTMAAVDVDEGSRKAFDFTDQEDADPWHHFFDTEGVFVSEPFAYHYHVRAGDTVSLTTEQGVHAFKIAGVFYDYASDQGLLMMHRKTFDQYWQDDRISSMGLVLKDSLPPQGKERLMQDILKRSLPIQEVLVRSDQDLIQDSMKVFDRTFQVTQVLRLLALIVAFLGILGALMALALEKSQEWALLRSMGFRPWDVFQLVVRQTLNLGLFAAVFSIPLGFLLSQLLIHVINKRSFGWTIDFYWEFGFIGEAFLLALTAALISSIYPAYRMSRMMVVSTLKGD